MTERAEPRSTEYLLGQMDGRVEAVEGRIERLEVATAKELAGINLKLDAIQGALSSRDGERRMAGAIGHWAQWATSAVAAAVGYALAQWHGGAH